MPENLSNARFATKVVPLLGLLHNYVVRVLTYIRFLVKKISMYICFGVFRVFWDTIFSMIYQMK